MAWRGIPFPYDPGTAGAAPADPVKTFDQLLEEELARERAFAAQSGTHAPQAVPTAPAGLASAPAQSVYDVDMETASPELLRKIRETRRATGTRGLRKAGGRVDVEHEGRIARHDAYRPMIEQGYQPIRGAGRLANAAFFGLESAFTPGVHAVNRQVRQEQARQREAAARTELAGRELAGQEAYRAAMLGFQEREGQERSEDRRVAALARAHSRAAEAYERQETARANREYQAEMKRLAQSGKPLDPIEQQRWQWLEDLRKRDPEAFDRVMMADIGGEAAVTGGASLQKPPTVEQATKIEQAIGARLLEIDEAQALLDQEITGAGIFNRAGNEAVTVPQRGDAYNVPAANLQRVRKDLDQERKFLLDQQARLRTYLQTGKWQPSSVVGGPAAGMSLEDLFDAGYEYEGELPPPPGPGKGGKSVFDRVPGSGRRETTTPAGAAPVGPPRPGKGRGERSKIPSSEELAGMSYDLQLFYDILASDPGLTNDAAARLVREILQGKHDEPALPESRPMHPGLRR